MFLYSEITKTKCKVLRIGGIANHVHILLNLHTEVTLAKLMQTVKGGSSAWMGAIQDSDYFKGGPQAITDVQYHHRKKTP